MRANEDDAAQYLTKNMATRPRYSSKGDLVQQTQNKMREKKPEKELNSYTRPFAAIKRMSYVPMDRRSQKSSGTGIYSQRSQYRKKVEVAPASTSRIATEADASRADAAPTLGLTSRRMWRDERRKTAFLTTKDVELVQKPTVFVNRI